MTDRIVVDLDAAGRVSISTWWDGESRVAVGEPAVLAWPLSSGELADLRWYLEDYLRTPFAVYEDRGSRIEARLPDWGTAMFTALFGSGPAHEAYARARSRATIPGAVEIVLCSAATEWLGLPWELLRDPLRPTPLALDGIGISRSLPTADLAEASEVAGQRLRVLMVISRPAGAADVGYRTIARPLLRRLAAMRGKVEITVLRPPTLAELAQRLRAARAAGEPFQIVHFDGHGALVGDRAGPPPDTAGPDGEGVLVFERPGGGAHRVPADQVARVLAETQVPVVVLNACDSGAVGKQLEATVATRLMAGGTAAVVAMAYRVYAVAAAEFMTAFYTQLFAGGTIGDAVRVGRARMARRPERPSPKGELPLADWTVPVYYWRREIRFPQLSAEASTKPGPDIEDELDRLRARTPAKPDDPLAPEGEFVGRDSLFHALEVAALRDRVVLLHGPGGTGKTELAKAFARWWRDTGGVDGPELVCWHSFEPGVASFGLDGVLTAIGLRVFGADFAVQDTDARRDQVLELLRAKRALLVWDNFESVVSMPDPASAMPPLAEAKRAELTDFLREIAAAGRSAVVITSRTEETWLGDPRRVHIGGLKPSEAVEYADQLLAPFAAANAWRAHRTFAELLEWLDGHPLSMRLVLPQLRTTDPAALLAGLRGIGALPAAVGEGRTSSLAASVDYSVTHLSPSDRRLLMVLSLVHRTADAYLLSVFSGLPETPQRFRDSDVEGWIAVLDRAVRLGLLTRLGIGFYRIHPALPAQLAGQWRAEDGEDYARERAAAEQALMTAYAAVAAWYQDNRRSDALVWQFVTVHRVMLGNLLGKALDDRRWDEARVFFRIFDDYWDRSGLTEQASGWADRVLRALDLPDATTPNIDEPAGALWLAVLSAQGRTLREARALDAAEAVFTMARSALLAQPEPQLWQRKELAFVEHQLGGVAHHRGQWSEAERYFRNSLAIKEELADQNGMAASYYQLGIVALGRGQWDEAEGYFRQALAIDQELNDQDGLALTHFQLGTLAQRKGRWDEAEGWYGRSLAIQRRLHDQNGIALCYYQLGMLAQHRGNLDEAEQFYHRSLVISEKLRNRSEMAHCYHQLSRVAELRRRWDETEQWSTRSLAIKIELGDREGMAHSYHQLGIVAQHGGQWEQAQRYFQQALDIRTELGDRDLAMLYQQLGTVATDRGQPDEAEQYFRRSLETAEQSGNRDMVLLAYGELARLAVDRYGLNAALDWPIGLVTLVDERPCPPTRPAPERLMRLAKLRGVDLLARRWQQVLGNPLPAEAAAFLAQYDDGKDEGERA